MKLFSQGQGLKPTRIDIQTKDIDAGLRNKIWNVLQIHYWSLVHSDNLQSASNIEIRRYLERLWHDYLKQPLDTLPLSWHEAYQILRNYFFKCDWNEVYDFIQFTASRYPYAPTSEQFRAGCNFVLEEELSGYRFVGDVIAPITDDEAIATIEQAQQSADSLHPVTAHLRQAVSLLSDRRQPDYRNSIKESISAIEAICRVIAKNPKATLGAHFLSCLFQEVVRAVSSAPRLAKGFSQFMRRAQPQIQATFIR